MGGTGVSSGFDDRKASETVAIYGYTGERVFEGKLQIVTQGFPVSRPLTLFFTCSGRKDHPLCSSCPFNEKEAVEVHFNLEDLDNLHASALALYADKNDPRLVIAALADAYSRQKDNKDAPSYMCAARSRGLTFAGKNERSITPCLVVNREGDTAPAWFVCNLEKSPAWMLAKGKICSGDRGRIGILVTEFTPDTEVAPPTEIQLQAARTLLAEEATKHKGKDVWDSFLWYLSNLLRKKSNLKGDEVTKGFAADILTNASPVWVQTPEAADEKILGATTCELGTTTTAKSVRVRYMRDYMACGGYIRGKISDSGLGAGVEFTEGIGWGVKKGALARFDLNYLVVDNVPPLALDNYIESRRDGVIMVTKIRNTEFWARTRLKLLANPLIPLDEQMYKCLALKMYDLKLIARFAFAITTDAVPPEDRYKPEIETLSQEEDEVLEALKIVLQANFAREVTYTTPEDTLWPKIMKLGRKLEDDYGCEDIPLYVRSLPYKLALLTYCFALIRGAENASEEDVQKAFDWLDYCAKNLEMEAYAQIWRDMHKLSEEEFQKLSIEFEERMKDDNDKDIYDTPTYRLVDYLAKNGKAHLDEIVAYNETFDGGGKDTVKDRAKFLKGKGLLKSGREGYTFSAKGVRFFRRWIAERKGKTLDEYPKGRSEGQDGQTQLDARTTETKTGEEDKPAAGSSPNYLHRDLAIEELKDLLGAKNPEIVQYTHLEVRERFFHEGVVKTRDQADKLVYQLRDEGVLKESETQRGLYTIHLEGGGF